MAAVIAGLWFTTSDWPVGSARVGFGAGALALLVGIGELVRTLVSKKRQPGVKRSRVGVISVGSVLVVLAASGIILSEPLRGVQANMLAGDNQWSQAVALYERGGERAPNSVILADIYNDWGEALIQTWAGATDRKSDYDLALKKFELVITDFTGVADQVTRARTDKAQAYLRMARVNLDAGRYRESVATFSLLLMQFAGSPAAVESHADHAKALLGAGKQDLATDRCGSAQLSYTMLSRLFADTAEGREAKAELLKPVSVTGSIQRPTPTSGTPPKLLGLILVKATLRPTSDAALLKLVEAGFKATVASDGTFVFREIPPGEYGLIFDFPTFYEWSSVGDKFGDIADAQPLCGYDFGTVKTFS